jgi:hypothetical protein
MSLSSSSDFPVCIEPGSWVVTAQAALDALGECADLAAVEQRFGSARRLAVATLGFAVSGGHATKPVIRALGRALRHPYGPRVAVAPLALCAAVYDALDDRMVVEVLDAASQVGRTYWVPDLLDLRDEVLAKFEGLERRAWGNWLTTWFRADPLPQPQRSRWTGSAEREGVRWKVRQLKFGWTRLDQGPDDLAVGEESYEAINAISQEWIDWVAGWGAGDPDATVEAGVVAARRLRRRVVQGIFVGPCEGGPVIDRPLEPEEWDAARWIARRVREDEGRGLLEGVDEDTYPAHYLDLEALPGEVLGVLIRRDVVAATRCRRLPAGLGEHVEFPYDLGTIELALRAHPLVVDEPTLRWRLARLSDDDLIKLAGRAPEHLAEAMAGLGLTEQLRLLMRECPKGEARIMAEWIPTDALRVGDAVIIKELAPHRFKQCPGAVLTLVPPKAQVNAVTAEFPWLPPGTKLRSLGARPYAYPQAVEELVTSLNRNGCESLLPLGPQELEANGEWMGNCTAAYDRLIRIGLCAILTVVHPSGCHYNVEVRPRGSYGLVIGQIRGRFNSDDGIGEVRNVVNAALERSKVGLAPRTRTRERARKLRRRPGGGVRTTRAGLCPARGRG